MDILLLPTEGYASNSYLIYSGDEGAIVDPSGDISDMLIALTEYSLNLKYIILTHGHYDHMLSLSELRDRTGAPVCIHKLDAPSLRDSRRSLFAMVGCPEAVFDEAEIILKDGDELKLGDEVIKVVHTPGHTPGCIMLDCGGDLISGDTLFDMSVGRSDFPGGDHETLLASIFGIYEKYPQARIYPGHGPSSTIEKQIKFNPFTKRR
ncbi:MAG: MBL fold metallo-hydrolase [Clostridia bacterium]|nr:MBL fold metallo-hydrolase [Clostridia bacterium]